VVGKNRDPFRSPRLWALCTEEWRNGTKEKKEVDAGSLFTKNENFRSVGLSWGNIATNEENIYMFERSFINLHWQLVPPVNLATLEEKKRERKKERETSFFEDHKGEKQRDQQRLNGRDKKHAKDSGCAPRETFLKNLMTYIRLTSSHAHRDGCVLLSSLGTDMSRIRARAK